MREVSSVAIEAAAVGLIVLVIFALIQPMGLSTFNTVALAGALTHVACEYTGFNHWWYLKYQKEIA